MKARRRIACAAHVKAHRTNTLGLTIRSKKQRRDFLLDLAVFGILNEPDDLDIQLSLALGHVLSHDIASQIELLGEGLVDDGNLGAPERVRVRELSTRDQRHAERLEIARIDLVVPGLCIGVRAASESLDRDIVAPIVSGEQCDSRNRDAGRPRDAGQFLLGPLVERLRALGFVAVEARRNAERDDVVDLDAEIDTRDVGQALDEQAGTHQERHRQCDLGSDQ